MREHGEYAFETDFDTIKLYKQKNIAFVNLNRPHVLNAMNLKMHHELGIAWDILEKDDDIWLIVIRGCGGRAFSVGQDLKERAALAGDNALSNSSVGSYGQAGWPRLTERYYFPKPIVAFVEGYALGGGFELALACDIILATENSIFGLPEATRGLIPGAGGIFRLSRQIPQRIAAEMLLTGSHISAERALQLGLINGIVDCSRIEDSIADWCNRILSAAPLSVRSIKEILQMSSHLSLADAFSCNYPHENIRRSSEDALEGARAFTEKRSPVWLNR